MVRRSISAALALALAAGCSSTGSQGDEGGTLLSLPATEVLRVQVVDHGEWGDTAFELEFSREGEPSVKAVRLKGKWSESARTFKVRTRSVPVRGRVTPAELYDLDQALRYYRSGPDATCNDTRFITLTRLRKGQAIDTERLVDESCGEGLDVRTSFSDLVARLQVPPAR
ncbi:MAG TPA: hypothetical protein VFD43_02840 [Planctomycetota bacterium]|nr:hypothetical protein [Planctomycetota bacterium]